MPVRYEVDGRVATITIDRPEAMNALDPPMLFGLAAAWDKAEEDDGVWVVVVTGAGDGGAQRTPGRRRPHSSADTLDADGSLIVVEGRPRRRVPGFGVRWTGNVLLSLPRRCHERTR